jgi:hypothetical protein
VEPEATPTTLPSAAPVEAPVTRARKKVAVARMPRDGDEVHVRVAGPENRDKLEERGRRIQIRERGSQQEAVSKPKPLREIIDQLNSVQFDPPKIFCEEGISGKVSPEDLNSLVDLDYEISLTEKNGFLVLTTGTRENVGLEVEERGRLAHSGLALHTHPSYAEEAADYPSFSDVIVADNTDQTTPLMLATPSGLLLYSEPTKEPQDARDRETMYVASMIADFCSSRGVALYKHVSGRQYNSLSWREKTDLTMRFAELSGMIIAQASWDDTEGIAHLMSYVNLEAQQLEPMREVPEEEREHAYYEQMEARRRRSKYY